MSQRASTITAPVSAYHRGSYAERYRRSILTEGKGSEFSRHLHLHTTSAIRKRSSSSLSFRFRWLLWRCPSTQTNEKSIERRTVQGRQLPQTVGALSNPLFDS